MKAGFFETDITPIIGMERPGTYHKTYWSAIHDPLKVRAGVFDDGQERVALVGVDTCIITDATIAKARRQIKSRCGLKASSVMIAASHTHAGGPLWGLRPEMLKGAPKLIRDLALVHSVAIDPLYEEWVVGQIVTAVNEADRRKEKVAFSVGSGQESVAASNRRFRMRSGRTVTHPGKGHADIAEPAGPIDPEVGVLAAWRPDGSLLGCVVNYACHGTTMQSGGAVTADWVYYLQRTVRGVMGEEAVVVFLNGACGDVTQVDNLSLREFEVGEHWARHVGTRVGAEALKVLVTAEKGARFPLAAACRNLRISRRRPSPASIRESWAIVRKYLKADRRPIEWLFAKERLLADCLVRSV